MAEYQPYSPSRSRAGKRKVDDTFLDDAITINTTPTTITTFPSPKRFCSHPPPSTCRRSTPPRQASEPRPGQPLGPLEPLASLPSTTEVQTQTQTYTREQTREQTQTQEQNQYTQPQQSEQQHGEDQHDEPRSSSPLTQIESSGVITAEEFARLEAQHTEDTLKKETQEKIERTRGEIRKNINFLKSLTPDGIMDVDTAAMLVDEIIEVSLKHQIVDSPDDIAAMKAALSLDPSPSRDPSPTPSPRVDADTTSPTSSNATSTTYVDASTITDHGDVNATKNTNKTNTTHNSISSDMELWKRELEGTRRPEPLVDPNNYNIITVITPLRQQPFALEYSTSASDLSSSSSSTGMGQGKEQNILYSVPVSDPPSFLSRAGPSKSSIRQEPRTPFSKGKHTSNNDLIDLDDDGDDQDVMLRTKNSWGVGGAGFDDAEFERYYHYPSDSNYGNSSEISGEEYYSQPGGQSDAPSFYNIPNGHASILLRYQDRERSRGRIPSPRNGLRLHLERYLRDINFQYPRDVRYQIDDILTNHTWKFSTLDDDESRKQKWSHKDTYLIKGFPLVEDVTFLVNKNMASPNGDCYWRALSFSLYGADYHWDLVKAEHLEYVHAVLASSTHPRNKMYSELLNNKFFKTSAGLGGQVFMANLWQILHMPHAWTPGAMQQITADLYNIHLVTFSYDSKRQALGQESCREVSVRGAYNARHVFMLYKDDNHFQPMTPNEHFEWEFRYPRLTVESTARFGNAPKAGSRRFKSSREHPWRWEHTKQVLPPVSRIHGGDVNILRTLMNESQAYN